MVENNLFTKRLQNAATNHEYSASEWALTGHVQTATRAYQTALYYAGALRTIEKNHGGISQRDYQLFEDCIISLYDCMKKSFNTHIRNYAESLNDLYESMHSISLFDRLVSPFHMPELDAIKLEFEVATSQFILNPTNEHAVNVYKKTGRYKDILSDIQRKNGEIPQLWVMDYLRTVPLIRERITKFKNKSLAAQLTSLISINEKHARDLLYK